MTNRKTVGIAMSFLFTAINLIVACFALPFCMVSNWAAREAQHWIDWAEK